MKSPIENDGTLKNWDDHRNENDLKTSNLSWPRKERHYAGKDDLKKDNPKNEDNSIKEYDSKNEDNSKNIERPQNETWKGLTEK